MEAINTAEKYHAINKTCAFWDYKPLIYVDHCGFIKTCVMQEDECPNFAINEDEIDDLWCFKSQCMDSIKHHFASQFGADSDNINLRITTPDFIEPINLKKSKTSKPNQRHPIFIDLQPRSILKPAKQETSSIVIQNNYQIENTKTNPEEHNSKNQISDEKSKYHATQRVPTEKSNVVGKEEDVYDNTLEHKNTPGLKDESIEDLAERLEREIENEFSDIFASEEPVADVVERLELELDKEFAECEQALIDIDTNYTGLEARAEEEELAEDLKILELKTEILAAEQKDSVILELKELFAATTNIPTNIPPNLPTNNPSTTTFDYSSVAVTITISEAQAVTKSPTASTIIPTALPTTIPIDCPTNIQFTLPVNLPSTKVKREDLQNPTAKAVVPTITPTSIVPTIAPTNTQFTLPANLASTKVKHEDVPYPFDITGDPTDHSTNKIYEWYQIKSAKKKPPKITPPKRPPPDRDKIGIVPDFRGWIGDFEGANGTRMSRERVC